MNNIKSPIFYMGNKYELLPQLLHIFPKDINTFYDMFGGSGVMSLNVKANKTVYNELNHNVVNLIKMFKTKSSKEILTHIYKRIKEFNLSKQGTDLRQPNVNEQIRLKEQERYIEFRKWYNESDKSNLDLYTLTYYSFCNLMRFNSKSEFNMPYGNRCFRESEHKHKIEQACYKMSKDLFEIKNENVFDLFDSIEFKENDFVYLDPPYLNTEAIYNEKRAFGGWNIDDDYKLFEELDKLNNKGVKWCLSNVKENKGKTNQHLIDWANKNNYRIIGMNKNYSALGKGTANTYEICVINYDYNGDGFKIIQGSLDL